jgi:hypothetical protein
LTFFFATSLSLQLCDLVEIELDGRLAAEDVHEDLDLQPVLVDLGDGAREVGGRAAWRSSSASTAS